MLGNYIMQMEDNDIRIACVGDIMPGGILHGKNQQFVNADVISYLSTADIRIATLETAIGENLNFDPEKMSRKKDIVYVPNSDLKRLKTLNINLVSIANNHIYDLGLEGLKNTMHQLDILGIKYCGAGINLEEASKPAIINVKGKSVAFISFCDFRDDTVGYVPIAEEAKPGINPLYDSHVISEIRKYKKICDYVFVIPHWGTEHTYMPSPVVWDLSRKMIKAGVDGIIGSHPHRVQPIINYKHKIIIYSLGNFMFFDRYINSPRPTYYPSLNENVESFPVTYEYPYVTEPTLKLWPFSARIGMIAIISLGKKINCEFKYTLLTYENTVKLYNCQQSNKISKKMLVVALALKSPMYSSIYRIYRCMYAIFKSILARV